MTIHRKSRSSHAELDGGPVAGAGNYHVRHELRPRALEGISDEQIDQHWKLYEGYVKNVNTLSEHAGALSRKGEYGAEFSELKRRLGFEYDGMLLHERYFAVLKKDQPALDEDSELARGLKRAFGGLEAWKKEFVAIAKMRGPGWAILYYDPRGRTLTNFWIGSHEYGHPAGFVPVLVLDLWEHAYMVDWGAEGKPEYIDRFFKNVDWARAEGFLREAL